MNHLLKLTHDHTLRGERLSIHLQLNKLKKKIHIFLCVVCGVFHECVAGSSEQDLKLYDCHAEHT